MKYVSFKQKKDKVMKQTAFLWGGGTDYAGCLQMESISLLHKYIKLISWGAVYVHSHM